MEGLTQPPVSPARDGDEGFALTQPPCVDEAGADAPPRIAFVLRPTAAAAAASTEPGSRLKAPCFGEHRSAFFCD